MIESVDIALAVAYLVIWGAAGLFGTMFATAFSGEPDEDTTLLQGVGYAFWYFLAGPIVWCMLLYFYLKHCRKI